MCLRVDVLRLLSIFYNETSCGCQRCVINILLLITIDKSCLIVFFFCILLFFYTQITQINCTLSDSITLKFVIKKKYSLFRYRKSLIFASLKKVNIGKYNTNS
jgi:hypothetical protein